MSEKIKVICVVGPTASGKTELSVEIAKKYNGEIVSADSMQLYKGIHIASAAPNEEEKQGIPHHLIEFLELSDTFSVADYVKIAGKIIKDIAARGKLPVIVGGTGLYIDSLVQNIKFTQEKTDENLRKELECQFDALGAQAMLEKLSVFDPETAKKLNLNDRRRIIRAFEVYLSAGVSITEQNRISRLEESPFEALYIGLGYKNREILYDRINRRVELMIENGLLDEAKATLNQTQNKGAMQAIGHKELHSFILGEKSLEDAVEDLKRSTRRYAKRQLTWFNRNKDINWIFKDEQQEVLKYSSELIDKFLK